MLFDSIRQKKDNMLEKAIIITTRSNAGKSISAGRGGNLGSPIFYRREQLDASSDEGLKE